MLPSSATLHLAPLSDAPLWNETITKARFWQQTEFYGVDLNPYFAPGFDEYFTAPVVGCFSPCSLMGSSVEHLVDFHTVTMADMKEFDIPISWEIKYTGVMHGVAGWFDLAFVPPKSSLHPGTVPNSVNMSTSPYAPPTHWQQVRLLLKQPLAVNAGQIVRGMVSMKANDHRSYDITAELIVLGAEESAQITSQSELKQLMQSQGSRVREAIWYLQEHVYNYSYVGDPVEPAKPESANMYLPVDSLLAESSGDVSQYSSANISSVQGIPGNATDFVVTTASSQK